MKVVLVVLTIAYPFLVYLGLSSLSPGLFGVCLAILVLLRLRMIPNIPKHALLLATMFLGFYALGILWRGSETLLLLYPALLNLSLLALFTWSLAYPPSIIERLSLAAGMHITGPGVTYTRGVTAVWCGFFLINGMLAAMTALFASRAAWALYNGLLAYLAMGLLWVAELAFRRRYKRLHNAGPVQS